MTRAAAPPSPTSTQTELRLSLELERDSGSALLRVVSTLHRRRCRVMHASFRPASSERDALDLVVQAPGAYAGRVEHWLGALVAGRSAAALPAMTGSGGQPAGV
jgi:hypothetical protein